MAAPVDDLSTHVQAHLPARTLLGLTRPHDTSATSPDLDVVSHACTDAIAQFAGLTGIAFDASQPWHLALATDLVLALLFDRAGLPEQGRQARERASAFWTATAKRLGADIETNASPLPTSADEPAEGEAFGRSHWDGFSPDIDET